MDLLRTFSTLALMASAILTLLPEGSLRKTAALALGLMITLCWAQGLIELMHFPELPSISSAVLAPTFHSLDEAEEAVHNALQAAAEVRAAP